MLINLLGMKRLTGYLTSYLQLSFLRALTINIHHFENEDTYSDKSGRVCFFNSNISFEMYKASCSRLLKSSENPNNSIFPDLFIFYRFRDLPGKVNSSELKLFPFQPFRQCQITLLSAQNYYPFCPMCD